MHGRLGDDLILKIALIGPGDELYFWWGHIGLVIEDRLTGQARFYDWGVFSFENENFFLNFAFGRLNYSCAVSYADSNYDIYISTNRDITLYTLDLPPEKKEAILYQAENNVLPENRDYSYHHFKDNCATRIRDVLDMALDGQLSEEFKKTPGRFNLRQHIRRHTWAHPFFDWLLNFWMSKDIEKPISVWDEMFLPSEIALRIDDFRYIDPNGASRLLVSSVDTINTSTGRPAVLKAPKSLWPGALLVSLIFSEILLILYLLWGKKKSFRSLLGTTSIFLGLFFGIAGSMLLFLMFFTDHDYTYHNINIFFVNPLFLSLVPLGFILAFSNSEKKRFVASRLIRYFWLITLLGSLLVMALKFNPAFVQENQTTLALVMPLAAVMIFIVSRLKKI